MGTEKKNKTKNSQSSQGSNLQNKRTKAENDLITPVHISQCSSGSSFDNYSQALFQSYLIL